MYSKNDIEKIFLNIRNKSYNDLNPPSKLRIKKMGFSGYSSPFTGDVYINLDVINDNNYLKDAIIGTIAHELAHQVSYRRRSFFGKVIFLWNYYLSLKKRRIVENEADRITIERGYGRELIAETKTTYRRFAKDKEMLSFIKKAYMSPKDIQEYIKKFQRKK